MRYWRDCADNIGGSDFLEVYVKKNKLFRKVFTSGFSRGFNSGLRKHNRKYKEVAGLSGIKIRNFPIFSYEELCQATMIHDFFQKDHFGKVLRPLNEMVGYGVSPNEFV